MIVKFDKENKKVQLVLRGEEICERLQQKEKDDPEKYIQSHFHKQPSKCTSAVTNNIADQ